MILRFEEAVNVFDASGGLVGYLSSYNGNSERFQLQFTTRDNILLDSAELLEILEYINSH